MNLVAADGHPVEVMDMSFANQALAAKYIAENWQKLEKRVTGCLKSLTGWLPG